MPIFEPGIKKVLLRGEPLQCVDCKEYFELAIVKVVVNERAS